MSREAHSAESPLVEVRSKGEWAAAHSAEQSCGKLPSSFASAVPREKCGAQPHRPGRRLAACPEPLRSGPCASRGCRALTYVSPTTGRQRIARRDCSQCCPASERRHRFWNVLPHRERPTQDASGADGWNAPAAIWRTAELRGPSQSCSAGCRPKSGALGISPVCCCCAAIAMAPLVCALLSTALHAPCFCLHYFPLTILRLLPTCSSLPFSSPASCGDCPCTSSSWCDLSATRPRGSAGSDRDPAGF